MNSKLPRLGAPFKELIDFVTTQITRVQNTTVKQGSYNLGLAFSSLMLSSSKPLHLEKGSTSII